MKYFKNYQMFTEAVDMKDVREYLQIKRSKAVIKNLDNIFKNLKKYSGATSSKRDERIYISSTPLKKHNLEIVFSRHAYDIATIGTNRGWGSQYDLINPDYVDDVPMTNYITKDISSGTIVAYLINEDDKNIQEPLASLTIKPYLSMDKGDNEVYYFAYDIQQDYSKKNPKIIKDFKKYVESILFKVQNIKGGNLKQKKFKIAPGLYNKHTKDDNKRIKIANNHYTDVRNVEELEYLLNHYKIKNYTINDDLSVNVEGDVYISWQELIYIPIKFRKVTGNFDCSNNQLISLEGCPDEVGGNFNCSSNNLDTLEHISKIIKGSINIGGNNLKTLNNIPKKVNGDFNCSYNSLISIEGSPSIITGDFDCSSNRQLSSLEGGPINVGGEYECSTCILTSLKGSPEIIKGGFSFSYNKITTLEYFPKKVEGYVSGRNNTIEFTEDEIKEVCDVKGKIFL